MYLLVDSCNKVQDLDTFPYEIQNGHATFWFSTALHKGLAQNNDNIHKKKTQYIMSKSGLNMSFLARSDLSIGIFISEFKTSI